MVNHSQPQRRHLKNRQNNPLTAPSASGINQSSSIVVATSGATSAPALAVDTTASVSPTDSGIPLAGTASLTATSTVSGSFSPTPTSSSSTAVGAATVLPMKTVIVSCVAALVGALLLILFGLAMYRRYLRSLQQTYKRNVTREAERRRSHLEPWSKMGDEKSSDMQMKVVDEAPMSKMFKKPASVRTAYTHKSEEPMTLEMPQSLAQYHPSLASKPSEPVTVHRPCLERAESGPIISWDADMLGEDASQQLSARSAGNTASIAIPTPVATRTLHRWESAEVINPDVEEKMPSSIVFQNEAERRKSTNNPFFKGTDLPTLHLRTRSNSLASLKSDKTKDRLSKATYDSDATTIPRPPIAYHVSSSSREEALNNPHAMESLIRALDVTEEEIQRRLRIVSMQPSTITTESAYTIEATDVTVPPSQ